MASNEGTVHFFLRHDDPDWHRNRKHYPFPPFSSEDVAVSVEKTARGQLVVAIELFEQTYTFERNVPTPGPNGISIAVTWNLSEVTLLLNGKKSGTRALRSVH